ncbi:hypothetical protein EVAR_84075_1 [Eumeta japonica]|uniref:Uncharacterized protein n=1 Tax=Eumeta variegata TaxID=151549 RepID=A0A4C1UZH1_EUMVA|nr:hypothetical protein EVAR_84075_1 [Eumeta japonica]
MSFSSTLLHTRKSRANSEISELLTARRMDITVWMSSPSDEVPAAAEKRGATRVARGGQPLRTVPERPSVAAWALVYPTGWRRGERRQPGGLVCFPQDRGSYLDPEAELRERHTTKLGPKLEGPMEVLEILFNDRYRLKHVNLRACSEKIGSHDSLRAASLVQCDSFESDSKQSTILVDVLYRDLELPTITKYMKDVPKRFFDIAESHPNVLLRSAASHETQSYHLIRRPRNVLIDPPDALTAKGQSNDVATPSVVRRLSVKRSLTFQLIADQSFRHGDFLVGFSLILPSTRAQSMTAHRRLDKAVWFENAAGLISLEIKHTFWVPCSGGATPLVDVGDIRREAVGGRRRRRRLAPPLVPCDDFPEYQT